MAARNSERLLNLVIALLAAKRFISREQIRDLVEGYSQAKNDIAFQRMFERDKEDLRLMGIDVLNGPTDPYTNAMDGYRIQPESFYLPEIHLTPEESTLVGLASSVWSEPSLASGMSTALAKLRAAGEAIDDSAMTNLIPRLTAREPGFPVIWEALLARDPVVFTYKGSLREVKPLRMILRTGSWYLIAETAISEVKIFKLSRIEDLPARANNPGSYELPDPKVLDEYAKSLDPGPSQDHVVVALREFAAGNLRRRGTPVNTAAPPGYSAISVPYAREDEIVSAICEVGPNAVVLDAGPIRDQVIAQLTAVAGGVR
ncbi:MAG: WYL domain-containing protein [Propionibacteriaceae bacterium]|nr:WYL domain-containing protein [Propionibacteriaceae bacterium]